MEAMDRKDPDSRNTGLLVCSGIGIFSGTSSEALHIYRQTQRCQGSDIDFSVICEGHVGVGFESHLKAQVTFSWCP